MSLLKHNMKNTLLPLLLLCFYISGNAQITVWSDNFNNGCASNCLATTWNGWTQTDNVGGVTGGSPNNWFVSCAEEGITPPGCGSSCIGDASMHIGADAGAGGDMGASFNETGATNATYRRMVSPTINATGHTGMTLYFDFIAFGSSACSDDRAQLQLSTDGGATWPVGYQYCLTSTCCGACNGYSQGQWTTYSLALPAAFDNNPNIRVGFHWRNNGNGSGTDPSVAIDDIRITRPNPLAVELLGFSAEKNGASSQIVWQVENERNFSHYELERSTDGGNVFSKVHQANGTCSGEATCDYQYKDVSFDKTVYYRLKMVDVDGSFTYSTIISLDETTSNDYSLLSTYVEDGVLQVKLGSKKKSTAKFVVYNIAGKAVATESNIAVKNGVTIKNMMIDELTNGVYILKIYFDDNKVLSAKVIKS